MSFILDALKKSETDRQRQTGPALFEVKVAPPKSGFPMWAIAIVALLAINMVIVGWLLFRRASHGDEGHNTAAASQPAANGGTWSPTVTTLPPPNGGQGQYNPQFQQGYPQQQGGPSSQQGYPQQQGGQSSQQGYPQQGGQSAQQGYSQQQGGPSSQQGRPLSQQGYPQSQQGNSSQQGYLQSQQGPSSQQGYSSPGYSPQGSSQPYNPQPGYPQQQGSAPGVQGSGGVPAPGGVQGPAGVQGPGMQGNSPSVLRSPAARDQREPTLANSGTTGSESASDNPDDYAPAQDSSNPIFKGHVRRGTSSGLMLYQDLAVTNGANLPELRLDLHAYDANPQNRFALINMQKVVEGQSIKDVRVEAITQEGVVMSHNGTKFLLPRD